jgi:prepilin-type N-terminal cleavage/methylation domain-containing protein
MAQIFSTKNKGCIPLEIYSPTEAKQKEKMFPGGFTLVELLVVVAVIGLLATIVVVNTSNARNKAKNNTIIKNINALREAGEIYNNNNGSYANFCVNNNCASGSTDWKNICSAVKFQNGNSDINCNINATNTAWCASSPLAGGGNYCVDSANKNTGGVCPLSPANPACP